MDAFHSTWTAPGFALRNAEPFMIDDFDLLSMILSALEWRKLGGGIRMVTDETGARYYRALGLEHIWDLGLEPFAELPQERGIDPFLFWAAGKLFALRQQRAPCVMIDTDFIVWEDLSADLAGAQAAVIHREALDPAVYPAPSAFRMKEGYAFDPDWDWSQEACNTALLYIGDDVFKEFYTRRSIEFMENLAGGGDRITGMVFAEQRMLALCAAQRGIGIRSLSTLRDLAPERQSRFSHLWGFKDVMRHSYAHRREFCRRCVRRILRDFPAEEETLRAVPAFAEYFED